jgi:hypothetical protein
VEKIHASGVGIWVSGADLGADGAARLSQAMSRQGQILQSIVQDHLAARISIVSDYGQMYRKSLA